MITTVARLRRCPTERPHPCVFWRMATSGRSAGGVKPASPETAPPPRRDRPKSFSHWERRRRPARSSRPRSSIHHPRRATGARRAAQRRTASHAPPLRPSRQGTGSAERDPQALANDPPHSGGQLGRATKKLVRVIICLPAPRARCDSIQRRKSSARHAVLADFNLFYIQRASQVLGHAYFHLFGEQPIGCIC